MRIGKTSPTQEPERPRRGSLFKFLARTTSSSNFANTADIPVTATASNPIRRPSSSSLAVTADSRQTDGEFAIQEGLTIQSKELENKVDEISRFVFAMVAQERANIHQAATIIQSAFRGFQARERIKTFKSLEWYGTSLFPPTIRELREYGKRASHVIGEDCLPGLLTTQMPQTENCGSS